MTVAAHRSPLSRDVVLEAAAALAREGGLDSVSSRAVAARLEVTPMALYRHVRDMDEIVATLVDAMLAARGLPDPASSWRSYLEVVATGLRDLFVESPGALGLFNRQPVTTPAARARLDGSIAKLVADGFASDEAVRAYAAVHTYTIGFCSLEAGRRQAPEPSELLDAPKDPSSRSIRSFVTESQFLFGLRALVEGLDPTRADR